MEKIIDVRDLAFYKLSEVKKREACIAEEAGNTVSAGLFRNTAANLLVDGLLNTRTINPTDFVELAGDAVDLYFRGGGYSDLLEVAPVLLDRIGLEYIEQRATICETLSRVPRFE